MNKIISCCGVIYSECEYYPIDCKSCPIIKGQVFWFEYTGEKICGIYDCCVNTKKIKHCGKCEKVPCNKYNGSDPTKTLKENNEDLINQLAQLRTME